MIQMFRKLFSTLFHDEIQQLQDELMRSYSEHWETQDKLRTCEERLDESLSELSKYKSMVEIYEHAEKFSNETTDRVSA